MGEGLWQPLHLVLILGIALIVFGPKKLPELGKGLGEAIRGFKSAMHEGAVHSGHHPLLGFKFARIRLGALRAADQNSCDEHQHSAQNHLKGCGPVARFEEQTGGAERPPPSDGPRE